MPVGELADCTGLLLAAGHARRFGADKLLSVLADGRPLALAALSTLQSVVAEVRVVLRPQQTELAELCRAAGAGLVWVPETSSGLGENIARGVAACPAAAGWLVALADMPWLSPASVRAVADALAAGADIAAPVYRGRRGHPVGFAARWGPALCALRGDEGARALLAVQQAALVQIEVADAGVLRDVDVPQDLP
ncbi:MAG: nucleotidyltransferase family protein [Rhodocyclaceae bacterium]|nr:nucleotidyltransferase family protein [Rhodocyclaceae bacterium]MBX3666832.1 nucleotidyltransferase family protein [Rhodocyclaceae bacterium]